MNFSRNFFIVRKIDAKGHFSGRTWRVIDVIKSVWCHFDNIESIFSRCYKMDFDREIRIPIGIKREKLTF